MMWHSTLMNIQIRFITNALVNDIDVIYISVSWVSTVTVNAMCLLKQIFNAKNKPYRMNTIKHRSPSTLFMLCQNMLK